MRVRRFSLFVVFVGLLLSLPGCFGALADLDSYQVSGGGDFCWHLIGYSPHALSAGMLPQAVGLRIIDASNSIAAIAVYDPLPTPDVMGTLSGPLTSSATYHVQIFADRNMDRMIEPYMTDHTWDLDYAMFNTAGCFTFPHGEPFNMPDTVASRPDDPTRGTTFINVGSRVLFDGRTLILTVRDVDSDANVLFYRYIVHPTVDVLPLQDLLAPDRTYLLTAFLDANEDGVKDGDERSFSDMQTSPSDGTDTHFGIDLMHPAP